LVYNRTTGGSPLPQPTVVEGSTGKRKEKKEVLSKRAKRRMADRTSE